MNDILLHSNATATIWDTGVSLAWI